MITITDAAAQQIKEILSKESADARLRMFVSGGGCSGFNYGFAVEEQQNDDDFVVEQQGIQVLIDALSLQYVEGCTVDYKTSLMGNSFSIDNPNATATCGCGSSFAI